MLSDCAAEPARSRMHEHPHVAFRVAVELDEVVAATERAQLQPREREARALERAR